MFDVLRDEGVGRADIARDLHVTTYEIDELTYGLLKVGAVPDKKDIVLPSASAPAKIRPQLTIIK